MRRSERLRIEVVSRTSRPPLPAARCRRLLQEIARRLPPPRHPEHADRPASLSILFAGEATLRSLNARFRAQARATDVLSFPAAVSADSHPSPEGPHLGDLAIGVPAARRQARRHGHSLRSEIEILLLHGYLHLLGYDHETDDGEMERLERRLRRRLRLSGSRGAA